MLLGLLVGHEVELTGVLQKFVILIQVKHLIFNFGVKCLRAVLGSCEIRVVWPLLGINHLWSLSVVEMDFCLGLDSDWASHPGRPHSILREDTLQEPWPLLTRFRLSAVRLTQGEKVLRGYPHGRDLHVCALCGANWYLILHMETGTSSLLLSHNLRLCQSRRGSSSVCAVCVPGHVSFVWKGTDGHVVGNLSESLMYSYEKKS